MLSPENNNDQKNNNNEINNPNIIISEKEEEEKNNNKIIEDEKMFAFNVNSYCQGKKGDLCLYQTAEAILNNDSDDDNNGICNEPLREKITDLYIDSKEYIEYTCNKCFKSQRLTISCEYDGEDNKYIMDFELMSPLFLLSLSWFRNCFKIEPSYVFSEYLEEYLSAMFYFYELNLPCEFLIPNIEEERELKETRNVSYSNINSKDYYEPADIDKIIHVKTNKKEKSDDENDVVEAGLEDGERGSEPKTNNDNDEVIDDENDESLKNLNLKSCFKTNSRKMNKNVEFK
jgi:hypothetical protein